MSKGNMPSDTKASAKAALNKIKMEAASEVGVDLKQGYNGDLTSRQAGSIGGQMVKIMTPERHMKIVRKSRTLEKHRRIITYIFRLVILDCEDEGGVYI